MTDHLFIVGPGRSGTSILLRVFNASRDIYLFSELHAPIYKAWPKFRNQIKGVHWADGFLAEKRRLGQKNKGADDGMLTGRLDLKDPIEAYAIPSGYRYVGEKVALFYGRRIAESVPGFFEQNFPDARFVCTLRRPSNVYFSAEDLRKTTPWGFNPERALGNTAAAVRATCALARRMKHSRLLPLEFMDAKVLTEVGNWLAVPELEPNWRKFARPNRPKHYGDRLANLDGRILSGLAALDAWYEGALDDHDALIRGPGDAITSASMDC